MSPAESFQFNLLFVCLGNICRSPLAEALFRKKIVDKGLQRVINVDSCGTSDYHIGELPDPRTIKNAATHGVSLNHLGRQLKTTDFSTFNMIVVMDDSNMANLEKVKPKHSSAVVKKMGDFYPNSIGIDVPDPWFGGEAGFESVYTMLDQCTDELMKFVEKRIMNK